MNKDQETFSWALIQSVIFTSMFIINNKIYLVIAAIIVSIMFLTGFYLILERGER